MQHTRQTTNAIDYGDGDDDDGGDDDVEVDVVLPSSLHAPPFLPPSSS